MTSPDDAGFPDRTRSGDDAELRRKLYGGTVFLLPATTASRLLVDYARDCLDEEVGPDPRTCHERYGDEELFERVGRVRRRIYTEPTGQRLLRETAASAGFPAAETAFDPARLRAIIHGAADNPRAAPVYYPHRDTWYGHPGAVVTIWTALDDLDPAETFVFYPERFDRPVANDSEIFDYDDWVSRGWSLKIGWQDRNASLTARYPQVVGREDYGPAAGFSCRAGEILLFSGSHFHRTLRQDRGLSRFSLDARMVHLGDYAAGAGAPDSDNRSRGSAVPDYIQPGTDI
ncbi:phytanoyl-CoA dioxygenase family protein [Nocardia sp. NPDC051750]|uniref:phytanoyl-CoA dioxygenase family protein n=1 Tax=Nocardia sp. NPDC051750 TaxID=3364325 RepID=UPI00379FF4FE